jgi:hypothetical protein
MLERLARDKRSSLSVLFISDEEKSLMALTNDANVIKLYIFVTNVGAQQARVFFPHNFIRLV